MSSYAIGFGLARLARQFLAMHEQAEEQKQLAESNHQKASAKEKELGQVMSRILQQYLPAWGYRCIKKPANQFEIVNELIFETVEKKNERILMFTRGREGWACINHVFADKYSWLRPYYFSNALTEEQMKSLINDVINF